jgi:hypothetical protein
MAYSVVPRYLVRPTTGYRSGSTQLLNSSMARRAPTVPYRRPPTTYRPTQTPPRVTNYVRPITPSYRQVVNPTAPTRTYTSWSQPVNNSVGYAIPNVTLYRLPTGLTPAPRTVNQYDTGLNQLAWVPAPTQATRAISGVPQSVVDMLLSAQNSGTSSTLPTLRTVSWSGG